MTGTAMDVDGIVRLEIDLMTALQMGDGDLLECYLGADYTMTAGVPGREVRTRADWLRIGLHEYVLDEFCFEELTVQLYAGCAVARSRFTQRASMNGSPRNSTYRITDVWVPGAAGWQLQARHSQRVAGD